jgi:quercetin dioxygenase-like cupin family protein
MNMKRVGIAIPLVIAVGIAVIATGSLNAQQPSLKRTEVLREDMARMNGKEAHMWLAEISPGAATGKHSHPTPRFVYVIEGSVAVEMDGKPTQIFKTGEGFQEMPGVAHNFRNASTTEAAKALGFQIAERDQPLQN